MLLLLSHSVRSARIETNKKNGEIKKEVAILLKEATCESMTKIHIKYGAVVNMNADASEQIAA